MDVFGYWIRPAGFVCSDFGGYLDQRCVSSIDLVCVHYRNFCRLVHNTVPLTTMTTDIDRNIVVQLTASQTFTAPPYSWSAGSVGLLSLSGFIGSVLAFDVGGRLIDIISTRLTHHRRGQRIPEYRLPAIIIPGTIGPAGILIFGLCIANRTHWIGPAFGYAMQAFGVAAISNVAVTYSLDCYKPVCIYLPVRNQCMKLTRLGRRRSPGNHLRHPQHDRNAAVIVRIRLD